MALLIGAAAMVFRYWLDRRGSALRAGHIHDIVAKPLPTVIVGMVGGLIVGITSVGSGSLMIIMLLFLYPTIRANQLVGTELTQAVPLTAAAALGALAFGHVEFGETVSLILGCVPAVLVGSLLSSSAPDHFIRPAITFVIFASGLKYVGVGTEELGWILVATLLVWLVVWLAMRGPLARPAVAQGAGAPPDAQDDAAAGCRRGCGPRARRRAARGAVRVGRLTAPEAAGRGPRAV